MRASRTTPSVTAQGANRREFIPYLHAFRGVAIILIMMTHLDVPRWFFNLTANGTVFFVFISGFLFAYLYNEETTTRRFLVGKMGKLLLPYAVSVLPGLFYVYATQLHDDWATYTVLTFATGVGHFNDAHWYIPFISLMFLSYPVLGILQRRPRALVLATVIWLSISVFTFRSAGNGNPFYSVLHFGSVFLAGMTMSHYRTQFEDFSVRWFWVIILISIAGFLTSYSLTPGNFSSIITMEQVLEKHIVALDYSFIGKLLLIPATLLILSHLVQWRPLYALLSLLADTSFALFFWHMYVIKASNSFLQYLLQGLFSSYWLTQGTILTFQLFLCIALIVSSIVALRRILGRRSIYLTG
jgi:peptidoglycan/LPS O-acetylase OafA/YrhL